MIYKDKYFIRELTGHLIAIVFFTVIGLYLIQTAGVLAGAGFLALTLFHLFYIKDMYEQDERHKEDK